MQPVRKDKNIVFQNIKIIYMAIKKILYYLEKTELMLKYKITFYGDFLARKSHRKCRGSQSVAKKGKDICV